MDVKLKPEYSIGWIANAETGIGSKDRYLGRLFALRFTPHSRLSAFGNMNNLNENRTPGRNGEWSPSNINNGLIASKVARIDYNVENKEGNFTLNGNAKIEHSNSDNSTVTNSVNFLTDGDTYERSQSLSHSENTQINTNHSMTFTRGIIYITPMNCSGTHALPNEFFMATSPLCLMASTFSTTSLMYVAQLMHKGVQKVIIMLSPVT